VFFLRKIVLLLSILPATIYATTTTCNIVEDQNPFNPQVISWNDTKKTAEITTGFGQKFEGIVLDSRDYDTGKKVNTYFKYKTPYLNSDAAEFIIYPISNTEYGISGVQYITKKRKKILDSIYGNQVAICKISE
jgi:hypothetical protein